jgi:uncharacterized phage protein gp47/JayE
MPFTANGYEVRRFRDIQEQIRNGLETNLGTPISSDPDSVIGITNSIFSNEVARVENNIQALVQNISIFTAEGKYLDELVYYIGLRRRPPQAANGSLKVWRDGEGLIPSAVLFTNNIGTEFICSAGLFHTLNEFAEALLSVGTVEEDSVFSFTLNGLEFSYTALDIDTTNDVVDYFASEVFNQLGITAINEAGQLRVVSEDEDLNSLSMDIDEGFSLEEIAVFAFCEAVQTGQMVVPENTITTIVTNNPALLRATNPLPFEDGTDLETDEELRARHQNSIQLGGNATVPAIVAKLLQLNTVTQAYIIENRTLEVDSSGRPPKSYETYVVGGDPIVIGQEIWNTKPAGVETTGEITTVVLDNVGEQQAIKWSRPENVYIFVRVTYNKYDEESFPTNGEAAIADAVLTYGNTLDIGKDVIPTRFIGGIYQAISGVDTVTVEVGYSLDIGDTEPTAGYGFTTIPIDQSQVSQFTLSRIDVIENI